ncbi:YceI family protein [bacterium]|nr:YceI family protein [bacterium]
MRNAITFAPLVSTLLLGAALAASSDAARFDLDSAAATDTVFFRSTASLEFIEGRTTRIEGGFEYDPTSPTSDITGAFRVDLRTLKTGIELRDEHMRDRHLETEQYPFAYFEADSIRVTGENSEAELPTEGSVFGRFIIHGENRPLEADLRFRYTAVANGAAVINARVSFEINLEDYKIKRPKALFLKLAETIEVELLFQAKTNRERIEITLPKWVESR